MTATLKNLAATAVLLPPKDREYLAERLLASLDETATKQQWVAEAKRRRDEVRSGRVQPIPAEEVYRRIDRLLAGLVVSVMLALGVYAPASGQDTHQPAAPQDAQPSKPRPYYITVRTHMERVALSEIERVGCEAFLGLPDATSADAPFHKNAQNDPTGGSTPLAAVQRENSATNQPLDLIWMRVITEPQYRSLLRTAKARGDRALAGGFELSALDGKEVEVPLMPVADYLLDVRHPTGMAPVDWEQLNDAMRERRLTTLARMFPDEKGVSLKVKVTLREFLGCAPAPAATDTADATSRPGPPYRFHEVHAKADLWDGQTLALAMPVPEARPPGTNGPPAMAAPGILFLLLEARIIDSHGNPIHDEEELAFAKDNIPPQPTR